MKRLTLPLFIASLTVLTACSVTPEQCDPSVEASVWNKMACKTSGTYDNRVKEKERTLQSEKAKQTALHKTYAETQKKAKGSERALAKKKAELVALNKSVTDYATQLKQKAKGKEDVLAEVRKVEQQLKQVNGSAASEEAKQAEIKALKRKLEALQAASGI
ncbi:hypothetical protein O7M46_05465 [Bisgaard Taxon 45]|uniref:Lipoprotein n=1 Tax=Bisgaard Taxon 45 TaxID=304289 RepID=A0ABT9KEE4_9PAST|nr:hypothetical protein [Bisgaard Taxon 45]